MKPFQMIFIGAFIFIAILAVFVFARSGGESTKQTASSAPVVIWGTVPRDLFEIIKNKSNGSINIDYVQQDAATFQKNLLIALADGTGPDAIIVSQGTLLQNISRIVQLPYQSYSKKLFQDSFIPEAQLFDVYTGYAAIPLMIDPMVMYYNKDTLVTQNIPLPPKYWDEVINEMPQLSDIDESGTISKSAIALGEYGNIENAKSILSMLFLQSGNPIATYAYDENSGRSRYESTLTGNSSNSNNGVNALNFYTQFSDPVKTTYSWNGSFSSALDEFASGNTAFYIGFASEENKLKNKNPNLNFGITTVPQSRSSQRKATYGNIMGLAVLKSSKNPNNAFNMTYTLSSPSVQSTISTLTNLPPVRLDLLQQQATSSDMSNFYVAALQSQGWLDKDPMTTDGILKDMVDSVTSGRATTDTAVNAAGAQINQLNDQQS